MELDLARWTIYKALNKIERLGVAVFVIGRILVFSVLPKLQFRKYPPVLLTMTDNFPVHNQNLTSHSKAMAFLRQEFYQRVIKPKDHSALHLYVYHLLSSNMTFFLQALWNKTCIGRKSVGNVSNAKCVYRIQARWRLVSNEWSYW